MAGEYIKILNLYYSTGFVSLSNFTAAFMVNIAFQTGNNVLFGDVSLSSITGNNFSKRMIIGSDSDFYIEQFDGTSMNYTVYPF
jgi:hypothetical protein